MADAKPRFSDRLYTVLLGAAVAALAFVWRFDAPPPDLLDDLAAAAGLRPPAGQFSLLWHHLAGFLCRELGLQGAESVLRAAGHVSLGLLAVMSVSLFSMAIPSSFGRGGHLAYWWRMTMRFVLFQGAALLCFSNPVWNAFRWLSPLALDVLVAMLAAVCFMLHFRTNRQFPLMASFTLAGLLAADVPTSIGLPIVAVAALLATGWLGKPAVSDPNAPRLASEILKWRLTLSFALGAVAGAALEVTAFESMDGFAAFGWSWGDYGLMAPMAYVKGILASCSPVGAVLFAAVVVLPVLVEHRMIRRATDDERLLPYSHAAAFLACGIIAFTQLSGGRAVWFWTLGGAQGCVRDGFLKCAAMLLCSLAFVWALVAFTTELFLRNYRRVAVLRFQDEAESSSAPEMFASAKRMRRVARVFLLAEPFVVFACVVPSLPRGMERAMLGVVADAARETAEECGGADWLFTDGGLDAAVELAAARAGQSLRALSLMGGAVDPREAYIRKRGVTNAEDRALLESGAPDALRTWVRSHPEKASRYAVQIGFEVWRRDGRPMPECSGLVARPAGFAPGAAERGAKEGRALAKRVVALYASGKPDDVADRAVRDAFLFAQWRLAVLSRHRAEAYDAKGMTALAMEETRVADALDKKNGALARIRATMAWASKKRLERMTSQEGLKLGLARADFALARIFALRVLDVSPDDPAANFAIGMDFFVQQQYSRAEAYLERCRIRRPDDPAVLNNLAQCRLRQGDAPGALPYAKRALEILPDSPEVRRTMDRIATMLKK